MSDLRPVPGDPSRVEVKAMLEADDSWFLTRPGETTIMAVETMRSDGSGWQRGILMIWPVRHNHGDEDEEVRIMISVADAARLVESLLHTIGWLAEAEDRGR